MAISINGTSGISGVDGSAGTPALQGTDTNTGIAFGSDVIIGSTGGTERFRVDSSGRVLVGTSTNPSAGDGQFAKIVVQGYTNSATGQGYISLARGKTATSMVSGDDVGAIAFTDSTGYGFARIECIADATPGASDYPGRLMFSVTADGASSPSEALRISNDRSIAVTQAPGKYTISTSENATSVANSGTVDFSNFTGMIMISDHSSGNTQVWIFGGGNVVSLGTAGGTVGSMAYNGGINGYRWTNNTGATRTFGFFCVRTRQNG